MSKRFDVCSPRPKKDSDKPYWHRVGTAFDGEKGISIVFDSLPMPDKEGRVSVFLFEQKAKEAKQETTRTAPARGGGFTAKNDMDDDAIPFAAEFR